MQSHTIKIRVLYKDTDQMGVAYYSNYLVWFEEARTELFRKIGHPYKALEAETGLKLMVVEAHVTYKAPAEYDDLLDVDCILTDMGNSSMTFEYKVKRDGLVLAEGRTAHCFADSSKKPRRIPQALREALI